MFCILAIMHKYRAENAVKIINILFIYFMIRVLCLCHTSKWLTEQKDSLGHSLNTIGTDMRLSNCKSKLYVVVTLELFTQMLYVCVCVCGNELNGHLKSRESISDCRAHTAADRVAFRFKSKGTWYWTSIPCKAKMWQWIVWSARSVSFNIVCEHTESVVEPRYRTEWFIRCGAKIWDWVIHSLWSQDMGLSDSFVVEPRCGTELFIRCGAKIWDWMIHSVWSQDIGLSDSFVVEPRYRSEWFIRCGAKISDWFIRCGATISYWVIHSVWSQDIGRSDSFGVEPTYRTAWFIRCGAKISDGVIRSVWSQHIGLSDSFVVEPTYPTRGPRYPTVCLSTSWHGSSTCNLSFSANWLTKPTHFKILLKKF